MTDELPMIEADLPSGSGRYCCKSRIDVALIGAAAF
jgi:hypothetical protein